MQLEFSRQFFEKYTTTKFNENLTSGSWTVLCDQTDGRKDGQTWRS